jgi:hypothetical protein
MSEKPIRKAEDKEGSVNHKERINNHENTEGLFRLPHYRRM